MSQQHITTNKLAVDTAIQEVERLLDLIPEGIDRLELVKSLEPICQLLSGIDELSAEIYFRETIQQKFDLTKADSAGYIKKMRELRRKIDANVEQLGQRKTRFTADFDGLIDLVDDNGRPAFLVKQAGIVSVMRKIDVDDLTLVPPSKEGIPFLLPRSSEVLYHFERYQSCTEDEVNESLYDEVISYYKAISELPSEGAYHLLAAWTFHTYMIDAALYSPIIWLYGDPERGKTLTGKAMTYAAYRGIHIESLNGAHLIRATTDLKSTPFVDVRDFTKKAKNQQSEDIVLLRSECGVRVPRVVHPGWGAHHDSKYYVVFGPTVVATNEPLDDITSTRAICLRMPVGSRSSDVELTPKFALPLKEKLVAFRACYADQPLPRCEKIVSGRLGDITKPLVQIVLLVSPKAEPYLRQFICDIEEQRKQGKVESLEKQVVHAVISLRGVVKNGYLLVRTIWEKVNQTKDLVSRSNISSIGKTLTNLGFTKTHIGENGAAAIVWDSGLIEYLTKLYEVILDSRFQEGINHINVVEILKRNMQ